MNQTHIHLMVTHLPIVGSLMGAIVLGYGLYSKSIGSQIAAYIVFLVSSVGAAISYLTGEAAEETVENIQGISERLVEDHEEFALIAFVSLIILGVLSLIGLVLTMRKTHFTKSIALLIFVASIVCFGLMVWTGYLGGLIRHTEIQSAFLLPVL